MSEDTLGIAIFKSPQASGEMIVKRVGNHRQDSIETDFDKNGRRQSVEIEERNGFLDAVWTAPLRVGQNVESSRRSRPFFLFCFFFLSLWITAFSGDIQ